MKQIYCFFAAMMVLLLPSCGEVESPSPEGHPSHRDGVFSGNRLTITLDGVELSSVESVTVKSELISTNATHGESGLAMDPTFASRIIIKGFPEPGETVSFVTVSDFSGFTGNAGIKGERYEYVGEFTGNPLCRHEFQGLILKLFTTE